MTEDDVKAVVKATVIETLRQIEAERVQKKRAPLTEVQAIPPVLAAYLETRERVTIREVLQVVGLVRNKTNTLMAGYALAQVGWFRAGREDGPPGGPSRVWFYRRR